MANFCGILICLLSIAPLSSAFSITDIIDTVYNPPRDPQKPLAIPLRTISARLLQEIKGQSNQNANIVYSPVSIAVALALLREGAAGKTRSELDEFLFGSETAARDGLYESLQASLKSNNENITLKLANALFVSDELPVKDSFMEKAKGFQAKAEQTNFKIADAAAHEINSWIADATNDKIKDLIKASGLQNTKAVIVNAVYLDAKWQKSMTLMDKNQMFMSNERGFQEVPFMRSVDYYEYIFTGNTHTVIIPYANNELAMHITMPYHPLLCAPPKPERKLGQSVEYIDLQLPRFSIRTKLSLVDSLKKLGIVQVFSDNADLSKLSNRGLKVDKVEHEAFIKVNENGTEAAAATDVNMVHSSAFKPLEPIRFIVNRPFQFEIVHTSTGAPLFVGEVKFIEQID